MNNLKQKKIGIIALDTVDRTVIGSGARPVQYEFPVVIQKAKGVTFQKLYTKDPSSRDAMIDAGVALVQKGAVAVTGGCGYMAQYQEELANILPVPVLMSSLLQVPFASSLIGKHEKVGIICANSSALDNKILAPAGVDVSCYPVHIRGLEDKPHFHNLIFNLYDVIDSDKMKNEIVCTVKELIEEDPAVRALVCECTVIPDYMYAIRQIIDFPVFDFTTLINFLYASME